MADQIPDSAKSDMAAELAALIANATDDDLSDDGRYFSESLSDLTQCRHCEIGEYQRPQDGKLVEWLWNKRHVIRDMLSTRAAPPAMDREAVLDAVERNWNAGPDALTNAILSTLSADAIRQGEGELAREEAAHLVTIDQRDAAEAALSDAYRAVCGREPQWSNNFGYEDAVREMREAATPASHASDGGEA